MGSMASQKGAKAPSGSRQASEEPSHIKRPASRDGNDSDSRPGISVNRGGSGAGRSLAFLLSNHIYQFFTVTTAGPCK